MTSTPYKSNENSFSGKGIENIEDPFLGFSDPPDLTPHSNFCSFVLDSINMSQNGKAKKRMTKSEAARKTELKNLCKKVSSNYLNFKMKKEDRFTQGNLCQIPRKYCT